MSGERKVEFKIGNLNLVLLPRLTLADVEWMNNGSRRARTGTALTTSEATEVLDKSLEMLVRCAREHSPGLTKEQVLQEMALPLPDSMGMVAVALVQVLGLIPVETV